MFQYASNWYDEYPDWTEGGSRDKENLPYSG